MKKILRIFPRRTSYTPDDDMVIINEPPGLFVPEHDEVHISCTFSWDMERSEWLKYQWESYTDKPVLIGGPAYGSPSNDFIPGLYVKQGVVFTSRGCNNNCSWCCVPKQEGKLIELPIMPGNIIQDNNFLQCSREHKNKVFDMLRTQKKVMFMGGLECRLIDDHFIDNIKSLNIYRLWLACDTDSALPATLKAIELLTKAGYTREHIHCYVLSMGENMDKDEIRLRAIYDAGAYPFAMLYRGKDNKSLGRGYSHKDWRRFICMWSRPAKMRAHVELGTSFKDFY